MKLLLDECVPRKLKSNLRVMNVKPSLRQVWLARIMANSCLWPSKPVLSYFSLLIEALSMNRISRPANSPSSSLVPNQAGEFAGPEIRSEKHTSELQSHFN